MRPSQSNQQPDPRWVKMLVGSASVLLFLGLAWYLYQSATFLHSTDVKEVPQESVVTLQDEDTLEYHDLIIVRKEYLSTDRRTQKYGVVISRNGKLVYRHPTTVGQKEFCEMGLASLLGDHTEQVVIQQFTGGDHCCWMSWVLELGDSIRTLYRTEDFPELGHEIDFADLDGDGKIEIAQPVLLFESFDRIDYSYSPFPLAYFKFSDSLRRYVPANKTYAALFLKRAEDFAGQLEDFTRSNSSGSTDAGGSKYLGLVLSGTLEYVFAGRRDEGWAFFERWYALPERDTIRSKVQSVLMSSKLYRGIYDTR